MSSDNTSIPESEEFNDTYKFPEWYNKKKFMFHHKMLERLKKLRFLHTRSSQYYEKMNLYLFGPSITITALSGIASFMSTSQYVSEDAQNVCGISVGILASFSSVFQALAAAFQFSAKKEAHRTVAEQYNALIVKTKFEMEMPNEEDFIDKLEQEILDIQSKCNYFVPQFIVEEWSKEHQKLRLSAKNIAKNKTKSMKSITPNNSNLSVPTNFLKEDKLVINENTPLIKEEPHISINISDIDDNNYDNQDNQDNLNDSSKNNNEQTSII